MAHHRGGHALQVVVHGGVRVHWVVGVRAGLVHTGVMLRGVATRVNTYNTTSEKGDKPSETSELHTKSAIHYKTTHYN